MMKRLNNNEEGLVFISVLAVTLVMMVLTISVISMNISQSMLTESEVRRVKAEAIAMGGVALLYQNHPDTTFPPSFTMDNIVYSVTATRTGGTGPLGSDTLDLTIDY